MEGTSDHLWDPYGDWEEVGGFSRQGGQVLGISPARGKARDGQRMEMEDTP